MVREEKPPSASKILFGSDPDLAVRSSFEIGCKDMGPDWLENGLLYFNPRQVALYSVCGFKSKSWPWQKIHLDRTFMETGYYL